jgi:hemerythrin-like domain-containing protein
MSKAPNLLNDDGTASMATALLMSHHGFRRDIARFASALGRPLAGDAVKTAALAGEWQSYRATLHGHHEAEDKGLFPNLRAQHGELGPVIDRLGADHRRIDPLLARGDQAFGELGARHAEALAVIKELSGLLDEHLAVEEAEVIPFIRAAKQFPPPATDAEVEMFAQGFAWASEGVADEVLARVDEMLPASLVSKLPAARAAFDERVRRVWDPTPRGASRTAIPDARSD